MTINLNKFSKPVKAIVPIINGKGIYKRRKFTTPVPDGYYLGQFADTVIVQEDMEGETPTRIGIDEMLSNLPKLRGIAYGNSIIPLNFSVAKLLGYDETIPVHFMNAELGTIVITRRWEDGKLLFHEVDMGSKHQLLTLGVKHKIERNEELGAYKGLTPEMRYFYILMMLDKQRIEEWQNLEKLELSKAEKEKRKREFEESFAGRLQKAIVNAGGRLVSFNRRGDKIDLKWIVNDEIFHSSLDQNFRVLDLGFCAEGHDKDHSIASAVLLAKQFMDEDLIYRTRE
jgi:hypothetical protein